MVCARWPAPTRAVETGRHMACGRVATLRQTRAQCVTGGGTVTLIQPLPWQTGQGSGISFRGARPEPVPWQCGQRTSSVAVVSKSASRPEWCRPSVTSVLSCRCNWPSEPPAKTVRAVREAVVLDPAV